MPPKSDSAGPKELESAIVQAPQVNLVQVSKEHVLTIPILKERDFV